MIRRQHSLSLRPILIAWRGCAKVSMLQVAERVLLGALPAPREEACSGQLRADQAEVTD